MSEHPCCAAFEWVRVADFDHAGGVDLDLGQCRACHAYVMLTFYEGNGSTAYTLLGNAEATRFLHLQQRSPRELKAVLKKWVDL